MMRTDRASTLAIRPRGAYLLGAVVISAALAAVVVAVTLAVPLFGRPEVRSEVDPAVAAEVGPDLSGLITYTTSRGDVTVRANGEPVGGVGVVAQDVSSQETTPGVWAAPDDLAVAFVEEAAGGLRLSVWDDVGVHRLSQLSDPSSPELIIGAKVDARDGGGVPLLVAWSPDGGSLAYGSVGGSGDVLHVDQRAGWSQQSYELSDGYVGELAWSPDGRYLAISTYSYDGRDHTAYVLERSSGELTKLVGGCLIVWSPDSRYLAIHGDPHSEPGLWLVSVDGLQRQLLAVESGAYARAWTAD